MNIEDLGLTDRQLEIWRLTADGLSGRQIAALIFKSESTVENHRRHLYAKLGVHNAAEATRLAVARRVVPMEWAPVGVEVVA